MNEIAHHKKRKKITLIVLATCLVLLFGLPPLFTALCQAIFPLNTPHPYTIVNEVGEPLTIDQVWNEENIFEVTIDGMENCTDEEKLEQIKSMSIYEDDEIEGLFVMSFHFKNIAYPGFQGYSDYKAGLYFHVSVVCKDADGELIFPVPIESGNYHTPYALSPETLLGIGMESEVYQMTIPVLEGTSELLIEFRTYKDSMDYCYVKEYAYRVDQ